MTARTERTTPSHTHRHMAGESDPDDGSAARMDLTDGGDAHAVLSLLGDYPDRRFGFAGICEATRVGGERLGSTLQRLEARELLQREGAYWTATDSSQLATYAGMRSAVTAIERRYGPAEAAGWLTDAAELDDE